MKNQFLCSCYFQRNIFLKTFGLHVHFLDEEQFVEDYAQMFSEIGHSGNIDDIIKEVLVEVERRRQNGEQSFQRKQYIEKNYKPLHSDLYVLEESFLSPEFIKLVDVCKERSNPREEVFNYIKFTAASQVFSFPVFTSSFCTRLMEELKHFEDSNLPVGRPNTMNESGFLLEELGFYSRFFDVLREKYLLPIATLLYPELVGDGLDSQRAFVVKYDYEESGDLSDLALHYDNAEVTLNVSLTENFEGGELFFSGMRQEAEKPFVCVQHKRTMGVLHRGQHRHGAMPLKTGQRYNLIVWMRSSSIRNGFCPMCNDRPTLVRTSGDGDGFTEPIVDVCAII